MYSVCHACSVIPVFWFERKPDKELVYCAASEIENQAQTRPAVRGAAEAGGCARGGGGGPAAAANGQRRG